MFELIIQYSTVRKYQKDLPQIRSIKLCLEFVERVRNILLLTFTVFHFVENLNSKLPRPYFMKYLFQNNLIGHKND